MSRLRKNGQLDDAYQLAEQLLQEAPNNVFNRRAAAWVYLDLAKQYTFWSDKGLVLLEKMTALAFDETEKIWWEQLYWSVAKALFKSPTDIEPTFIPRFEQCWMRFVGIGGQAYSVLLKALLTQSSRWSNLPKMVESWGLNHLQVVDFQNELLANDKQLPSLAERVYLATAKAYLQQPNTDAALLGFLARLDDVSATHPEMLYLVYYRALLYHKLGRLDDALRLFIPFAQKKHRDFWVWDLLSQLHVHDSRLEMACLAKALTCKTPPQFLVKIRQRFAALLIVDNQWDEAKSEIAQIVHIREANRWRIPSEVSEWQKSIQYKTAVAKPNGALYTHLTPHAEALLFRKVAVQIGVIWNVNLLKQTAQFFVNEDIQGGFCYAKLGIDLPKVGQLYQITLHEVQTSEGSFWKVQKATPTDATAQPTLVRNYSGALHLKGRVGFVDAVFLDFATLGFAPTPAMMVSGVAVRSFNAKNKEWGWKAISVKKM